MSLSVGGRSVTRPVWILHSGPRVRAGSRGEVNRDQGVVLYREKTTTGRLCVFSFALLVAIAHRFAFRLASLTVQGTEAPSARFESTPMTVGAALLPIGCQTNVT